jgi:hypothetical protein
MNYGCLYLYNQQGQEALMGKMQAILHLNMQQGGKGSGEGKPKSFCMFYGTYYGRLDMQSDSSLTIMKKEASC